MTTTRAQGVALVVGSITAAALNVALPHDPDAGRFIQLVAASNTWPWLHLGLFVSVLLIVYGMQGLVDLARTSDPGLAATARGALTIGAALLLSGLAVAGTALRKSADNFASAIPEDRAAVFFSAVGFDRLSYSLYAAAALVLFGAFPLTIAVALWRSTLHRALAIAGMIAGAGGVTMGVVQFAAETDTFVLALIASLTVTFWSLAAGVALVRREVVAEHSRVSRT